MVLVGLTLVIVLLGIWVVPRFMDILSSFGMTLPWPTKALIVLVNFAPLMVGLLLALLIFGPLIWGLTRLSPGGAAIGEQIMLSTPLVGPVLRKSLAARWCDAAQIAVSAGIDLPAR